MSYIDINKKAQNTVLNIRNVNPTSHQLEIVYNTPTGNKPQTNNNYIGLWKVDPANPYIGYGQGQFIQQWQIKSDEHNKVQTFTIDSELTEGTYVAGYSYEKIIDPQKNYCCALDMAVIKISVDSGIDMSPTNNIDIPPALTMQLTQDITSDTISLHINAIDNFNPQKNGSRIVIWKTDGISNIYGNNENMLKSEKLTTTQPKSNFTVVFSDKERLTVGNYTIGFLMNSDTLPNGSFKNTSIAAVLNFKVTL